MAVSLAGLTTGADAGWLVAVGVTFGRAADKAGVTVTGAGGVTSCCGAAVCCATLGRGLAGEPAGLWPRNTVPPMIATSSTAPPAPMAIHSFPDSACSLLLAAEPNREPNASPARADRRLRGILLSSVAHADCRR